ncbi:Uncharacterized protein APZ42_019525 [Daphnia magna]|uniref:Uncharacterized protein n=1 Tax=Daphnia magna TaxID=35525 RepID=A0A164Y8I8_9CRUS|nr:Uncharacterized protein APZ42_019525 [Daphnia magna]
MIDRGSVLDLILVLSCVWRFYIQSKLIIIDYCKSILMEVGVKKWRLKMSLITPMNPYLMEQI